MARPYGHLKDLPALIKQYDASLSLEIERETEPIQEELRVKRDILVDSVKNDEVLNQRFQRIIRSKFEDLERKISSANTLKDISSAKSEVEFTKDLLSKQINQAQAERSEEKRLERERLDRERQKREENEPKPTDGTDPTKVVVKATPQVSEPSPQLVKISQIVPRDGYKIHNEVELDSFIEELRDRLKKELKDDRYIQFI